MDEKRLVTAHELADLLKVSVETIWRYTRANRIPYVQLANRKYRYVPESVMKVLGMGLPAECANELGRSSTPSVSGREYGAQNRGGDGINIQVGCVSEAGATYWTDRKYTYQDYLQIPDEECYSYEVLDGMLVREPAPTVQHQRVSRRLQRILEDHFYAGDPYGEVLNAPIDMTLSEINVCQPDLVYIPGNAADIVEEKRINGVPLLLIEILSPSTRGKDRVRKRRIYERLGVPHFWIVDPEAKSIEAYALKNQSYMLHGIACDEEPFSCTDFPSLSIDLAKLWKPHGP